TGTKDLNHGIARRSIFQDQVGDHSNRAVAIAPPRPSWPRHDEQRRRDGYCKYADVLQHWVPLACMRYRKVPEADDNLITKPETPYLIRSSSCVRSLTSCEPRSFLANSDLHRVSVTG